MRKDSNVPEPYEDEIGENEQQALAVISDVDKITVRDQPSLSSANSLLVDIKRLRRKFDEEFDQGIKLAFQLHRDLTAQKKKWVDPLEAAERKLKPKIAAYLAEEDRKRLEAQRAVALARAAAKKEAEDAADVAHELIREGRLDEAEELIDMQAKRIEEIQQSAPAIPEKPEAAGTHLVKHWTWDRLAVDINAMAADPAARAFLRVDEAKVTRYVQNLKWDARIAGIRIYAEDNVATRVKP